MFECLALIREIHFTPVISVDWTIYILVVIRLDYSGNNNIV